ncbi:MAG: hypothetical protein IBJ11_12680, partial [Phycisphaerales bacterium]|nr:hypothetical protein [Phycisphaerales bacterium]
MTDPHPRDAFHPVPGLMACVFPGLGYLYNGRLRRAAAVATGVLGLVLSGLLTGGIDVVDRREDRWWFVLQAGLGPLAFALDHWHQNFLKAYDPSLARFVGSVVFADELDRAQPRSAQPGEAGRAALTLTVKDRRTQQTSQRTIPVFTPAESPDDRPPSTKSLARLNESGSLMVALAGMLNLIAIVDCFAHLPPNLP